MIDLLLAGGGHSNVEVIRRFGEWRLPEVRVTLISREVQTPYSGMLPGLVAGHYSHGEAHIDLPALCAKCGVRFVHDEVIGLDPDARSVRCAGGAVPAFDVLSLDTGAVPRMADVPGASAFTLPVKPVNRFLAGWDRWLAHMDKSGHPAPRIVVVGGGAGGVEIALSVRHRWRQAHGESRQKADTALPTDRGEATVRLVTASDAVVATHVRAFQRRVERILRDRDIEVITGSPVVQVDDGRLLCATGRKVPFDLCLWVTSVAAPDWAAASGLSTDDKGFVAVDDCLRSVSHPVVFGTGDVASMVNHPRPKAGVFAVRQGPALAENLRRVVMGNAPRPFRPQRQFLTLMGTGDECAVGARGRLVLEGPWVWRWKQWIDRRWIRRYQVARGAGEESAGRDRL